MTPLASISYSIDHAKRGHGSVIDYETDGWGVELALANLVMVRRGHYQDLEGQIDDATWGFGVGLPLGSLGGASYDEAWVPQAKDSGLRHVHRRQFSVWMDPVTIVRALSRHRPTGSI